MPLNTSAARWKDHNDNHNKQQARWMMRTHYVKFYGESREQKRKGTGSVCAITPCGKDSAKVLLAGNAVSNKSRVSCPHCLKRM